MKQKNKIRVQDLVGQLGAKAPFDCAESWDNVGLLVGDPAAQVNSVVVSVNLGPEALEQAQKTNANVIVCHHPPIFKPVSKLTAQSHPYVFAALKAGISVIAMHTNFDLNSEELSKSLAERLGYEFAGFLVSPQHDTLPNSIRLGKFITYVPTEQFEEVRAAVCKAGAGNIGDYSQCSFSWEGEGTFLPEKGANPAIGAVGTLERVKERRLEVIFPWKKLTNIVEAARKAHPYEEMAFDVIELANPLKQLGYGFVGEAKSKDLTDLVFHKFIKNVKETFQLQSLTVVGPIGDAAGEKSQLAVKRMAFSPGSGSSFVKAAIAKGVDVYVCGEVGYHQMLEARKDGLTLVVLGHSYSEKFFVETVTNWCNSIMANVPNVGSQSGVYPVLERIHETV